MNRLTLYAIIFVMFCTAGLFASLIPEPVDCSVATEKGMKAGEAKGVRETTRMFTGGSDERR